MPPTSGMDTGQIVEAMVAAINSGRAEKVAAQMHPDGVFVDSLGNRLEGRQRLLDGWRDYYRLFPDYRIAVEGMMVDGLDALLWGKAGGTLHRGGLAVAEGFWQVPAAWRATTDGGRRLTLWQVFADTTPMARLLGQ